MIIWLEFVPISFGCKCAIRSLELWLLLCPEKRREEATACALLKKADSC